MYPSTQRNRIDSQSSIAEGPSAADSAAAWLASFCVEVEEARCGVVLELSGSGANLEPAAVWPPGTSDISYLRPVCDAAIKQARPIQLLVPRVGTEHTGHAVIVALPVTVNDALRWIVVLDLGRPPPGVADDVLRRLSAAAGWLVAARAQRELETKNESLARLSFLTDAIALVGEDSQFAQSTLNLVNDVARHFSCTRASLGVEKGNFIEVLAISNKASFDRRSEEVRLLADAMDEALDQSYPIIYPPLDKDALPVPAHATLARKTSSLAVCSIPLRVRGRAVGVLTLERNIGEPFAPESHDLLIAFGDVLGALFSLKREAARGVWRRALDALRDSTNAVFGPRHPGSKFVAIILLGVVVLLSFLQGEYRVAAKTVVEGAVQRAIVVPFDGFVAESAVRAGDIVKADTVMCRLDDKDLQLEKAKSEAQVGQLLPKYREALATHDAGLQHVLGAQTEQAQIELKLTEQKLARAAVKAPFDGVVVSGDLSQLLGTPVEKGKVLFEIAPLDTYRVILKVDERDVGALAVGQSGELAVSGQPDITLPFSVKQITPVSTAENGQNFFRVEAQMQVSDATLRPGMQGVGKIAVGERKLVWIWTHRLLAWAKLALWQWLP